MPRATLLRGQAGTEPGPEEPQASAPAPIAPYLLDSLVALLEDAPERPIKVRDGIYLRASAFVPLLIEALEQVAKHHEPQSLRADLVGRISEYTGTAA